MEELLKLLKTKPTSTSSIKEFLELSRLSNDKEALIEGWKCYIYYNFFFEEDYNTLKNDGIDLKTLFNDDKKVLKPIPLSQSSDTLSIFLYLKDNSPDELESFFNILLRREKVLRSEMLESYIIIQNITDSPSSSPSLYWSCIILPIHDLLNDDLLIIAFSKLLSHFNNKTDQNHQNTLSTLKKEYILTFKDIKKRLTCYKLCLKSLLIQKIEKSITKKFYEDNIIPYNERSAWMECIYYEIGSKSDTTVIRNLYERASKEHPSILKEWRTWELMYCSGPTIEFLKIFENYCEQQQHQPDRKKGRKMDNTNTVFLNNLSYSIREEDIVRHFKDKLGVGVQVHLKMDRSANSCKGYGYCIFDSSFKGDILSLDRSPINGRPLFISEYQLLPKNERKNNTSSLSLTLFLSHLPEDVSEESIRLMFDVPCIIRMVYDDKGHFRQIAYVDFDNESDALRAKLASDHTTYQRLGCKGDGYINVQISCPPPNDLSSSSSSSSSFGATKKEVSYYRKKSSIAMVPRQVLKK